MSACGQEFVLPVHCERVIWEKKEMVWSGSIGLNQCTESSS